MKVEDFLELLDGVTRGFSGWNAKCPSHDDNSPSLSVAASNDGDVLVNCHAGCTTQQIIESMGLRLTDLFARNDPPTHLAEFGSYKRLPVEFLQRSGVNDVDDGGISIAYWTSDRRFWLLKTRRTLDVRSSRWTAGVPLIAYGLWHLSAIREFKRLILVEGESDALTGWYHQMPVIGLPGANTVRSTLDAEIVEGIEQIEVIQEPGEAGQNFVLGIAKQLAELRWAGTARVLKLGHAKDLSELHIRALTAHLRKYRSLMPSMALLFHLAETVAARAILGPVSEAAVNMAIDWVTLLEAHAGDIYNSVARGIDGAELIAKKIMSRSLTSPFTERDIYRANWSGLWQKQAIGEALSQLEQRHWVRKNVVSTKGRPKTEYEINPRLYGRGER